MCEVDVRKQRGPSAPKAITLVVATLLSVLFLSAHGSIDRISVTDGGRDKGRREHRITVVIKALSSNG